MVEIPALEGRAFQRMLAAFVGQCAHVACVFLISSIVLARLAGVLRPGGGVRSRIPSAPSNFFRPCFHGTPHFLQDASSLDTCSPFIGNISLPFPDW